MSESSPRKDEAVTLEALLRVKRAERPPPEFWEGFEERLHERMLREVVARPARSRPGAALWLRRAWLVLPAAAAAALLLWAPQVPPVDQPRPEALELAVLAENDAAVAETPAGSVAPVQAQFVSELLAASPAAASPRESVAFHRVLASEMLVATPVAAVYVANPLGRSSDAALGALTVGVDRF